MMDCPSCHAQAPAGAEECPACGIIFAKWRAREERVGTAPAAAPGPASGSSGGTPLLLAGILAATAAGLFYYLRWAKSASDTAAASVVEMGRSVERAEEAAELAEEAMRLRAEAAAEALRE